MSKDHPGLGYPDLNHIDLGHPDLGHPDLVCSSLTGADSVGLFVWVYPTNPLPVPDSRILSPHRFAASMPPPCCAASTTSSMVRGFVFAKASESN